MSKLRTAINRILSALVDVIVIYTVSVGSIVLLAGAGVLFFKLIKLIFT